MRSPALGSTFTNAANGTIQINNGAGGPRTITGKLVNQGQISVDPSSLLTIQGTYYAAGGAITGPGYLVNCTLYVTASPATPTTIPLDGAGDVLETNNLPNTTLWVQGNGYINQNATLTVAAGLTNDGTILLESQNSNFTSPTRSPSASTFTNAAAGTIQVNNGAGGARTITGTLVNQGQINVDTASYLSITGAYYAAGGSISGPGYLFNCTLDVTASPSSPTTILIGGGGDVLATNNLPNTTIWVQGFGPLGNASLTILDGLSNAGTILLQATTSAFTSCALSLGGTFTNAANGTIQINNGAGGPRTITGKLVNQGTINFDTNTTLGSTGTNHINSGLISIAGSTVSVIGSSFTNQVGGLVSGDGTFNTTGLSLTNNGIIDLSRPSILGVNVQPSTVAITYDDAGAMNVTTVTNPANYTILGSGGDGIFGNGNDVNESSLISQVGYNATSKTATLQLSGDLPPDFYRVEVNGSNVLDGTGASLLAGTLDLVNRGLGIVPAEVTATVDPASDSGASNHDGITNVTTPTFDVQVNQGGTVAVDFDGNGTTDATLSVPVAGTYQFAAPKLAAGSYTETTTFLSSAGGGTAQGSTSYTIMTDGPHVTAFSPSGPVATSVSQATVTFSAPVDPTTFTPTAITLTGPDGLIAVSQPQLVAGSTYSIGFATQTAQGAYTLTIGTSVTDYAGNEMDQNQNGINGEPTDSFTGSFSVALPDLAVTATQAPSSALLGAVIPVSWTVTNISATNPAPSTWTDAVYISPDSMLDAKATLLTSVTAPPQPPLAPGASYTRNVSVTIPSNTSIGNDFLLFVANDNGGQLESDAGHDTNDLVAVPITLVAPDLQVNGLSVQPANPISGSTLNVSWNDANTGNGATSSSWTDAISIVNTVTNQTLVSATIPYDIATRGALQPGESAAQQYSFTLPDGDPGVGNLAITVTTDSANTVVEGNPAGTGETNNTASIAATSTRANYPDLSVSQVAISPASPQSGNQVTVTWTDANTGLGNVTQSFDDSVEVDNVSTGQTLATATVPYDVTAALGTLAAGSASAPRQFAFMLPDGVSGVGNLKITVTTDSNDGIFEYDNNTIPGGHAVAEANNSTSITAVSTLAPYADLQVTGVSGPVTGFNSQPVLVTWTDLNNGAAPATGPWVDNVYVATDAQGDNPTLLGSFTFTGTLDVGASAQRTQQINLPQSPGTYWLMVTTNATQSVQEGANFGNDTTVDSSSIVVSAVPLPDLVVSSITPPPNGVFSGTSVPISFVVTNQGTGSTTAPVWQDWVILSQDPTLAQTYQGQLNGTGPGGDQTLNNQPVIEGFANPSYLGVGQSYEQTVNVTLPITAQGTWYVYVVPDGTGLHHPFAMPEISRTDKLAISAGFSVTLSPPPELDVTSVVAPAEDFSGEPMNLSWTVANVGTGPTVAGTWTDAVYMSPDPVLDSSATELGTFTHQGVLAAGNAYTESQTVNLPVGISGLFYFMVQTDVNGQVFENGATANNVAATFLPETVNLTPPPDLEVGSITLPATALAGHDLTFSYTTTNAGAGATPNGSWNDSFYLSPTPTYDPATAISLGGQTHYGLLVAGSSYTNSVTTSLPNGLTGAYYVLVDTDSGNAVFELDKTNNWGASTGTVQVSTAPPDLVVSSASGPAAALAGSAILVNWTVANQGASDTAVSSWPDDVYADTSSAPDSNAVLLGSFTHNGLLNPGDSYSQSQLVTLPISLLGSYNLFVVAATSG